MIGARAAAVARAPLLWLILLALAVWTPFLAIAQIDLQERMNAWLGLRLVVERGDPAYFIHPTLFYDLIALLYGALLAAARAAGTWSDSLDLMHFLVSREVSAVVLARTVSLAGGLLMVSGTYLLGRRLWDSRVGAVAALLCTFMPQAVLSSTDASPDALAAGLGAWSLWTLLRWTDAPSLGRALAAGMVWGLAVSANYPLGLFVLPILYAATHVYRAHGVPPLQRSHLVILVAALSSFAATSPYVLISFDEFWRQFTWQASLAVEPFPGANLGPLFYLREMGSILGPYLEWLALAGVVIAVREKRAAPRMMALATLSFLVVMSLVQTKYHRFLLPALPGAALFAARAVWAAASLVPERHRRAALAGVTAVALSTPLASSAGAFAEKNLERDPRVESGQWLVTHLPRDARLLVSQKSALLPSGRLEPLRGFTNGRSLLEQYRARFGAELEPFAVESLSCVHPFPQYCSGESILAGLFDHVAVEVAFGPDMAIRPWLVQHGALLARFGGNTATVEIYRLRDGRRLRGLQAQ